MFDFIFGSVDVYKHIGLPFFSFLSAPSLKYELAYMEFSVNSNTSFEGIG